MRLSDGSAWAVSTAAAQALRLWRLWILGFGPDEQRRDVPRALAIVVVVLRCLGHWGMVADRVPCAPCHQTARLRFYWRRQLDWYWVKLGYARALQT